MKKSKIIVLHFISFLVLSVLWFFSAEYVLRAAAPELNYVGVWINLVVIGIITIGILVLISLLVYLFIKRKH